MFVKGASMTGTSKNPDFIPTAALRKNLLLTYTPYAALRKFLRAARYAACLLTPLPRLAFGRTLNF
jgi:hypothetical protein